MKVTEVEVGNKKSIRFLGSITGGYGGTRPTSRRPATTSLKTSFQELIALLNATGISHPDRSGI